MTILDKASIKIYVHNNVLCFIVYKIKGKISKKILKISEFVSHTIFSIIIFINYFNTK